MTREAQAELPIFQKVEAIATVVASVLALGVSNQVITKYLVGSGNDLYATDPLGASLFAVTPLFAALGIKAFENRLPTDEAKDLYATALGIVGISTFVVWAVATAVTFAPSANGAAWLTAAADGRWAGIAVVLAHILGDAAWGYILIAAAEKTLLGTCKRIEIANPHYAEAEAQAGQAQADHAACREKLRELDEYLAAVPHKRTELQARIGMALRRSVWPDRRRAAPAARRPQVLRRGLQRAPRRPEIRPW